ncbi:VanZ family protein [Wenyingzhuangia sp. 1_MG-2023]|nr:VanZ family protein [Wenyingzhuangia sp. 1_MG-2023]
MQKTIKNLLEHSSLFLAIGFSVLIMVLSLVKLQRLPNFGTYEHSDKVKHLFAYSILSFFWLLSCQFGKVKVKSLHLILMIIGYGVIIEVLQSSLTTYRTGDLLDILANSMGILLGYVFLKLLNRIYLQV